MGKIRLFLSLNLKSTEIELLKKDQAAVKEKLGVEDIRWSDPEKFHLTLRFLGDIDEDKAPALAETLERLKFDFETIDFETENIGFFPESKYPNVIYAGLKENGNNSEVLVGFIDKIIYNFGVKPDKRFIPHITLGRFNSNNRRKITEPLDFSI
ncbi:MAG: RNA 2',3'-cyclic phosphodiesterase, partial [Ignavibacteria bacterium]|nr:RNA 2',3'-cyclic phosphodiesterase [Ignavibacteria bacterium]